VRISLVLRIASMHILDDTTTYGRPDPAGDFLEAAPAIG
jgi:hypothetical protein